MSGITLTEKIDLLLIISALDYQMNERIYQSGKLAVF